MGPQRQSQVHVKHANPTESFYEGNFMSIFSKSPPFLQEIILRKPM